MSDEWAAAPPGWIALDKLPGAVARALGADDGAVATILRPLIESGALPWRWAGGAEHPRSIRVTPGGILYGAVDHNGNPPPPDWAALFSGASVMLAEIEVDFAAACAAARRASLVGRLEPRPSSSRSAELELGQLDRATSLAAAELSRNKGGRPARHDWSAFDAEVVRRAYLDGGHITRTTLKREMKDWCGAHMDPSPDARTIERRVDTLTKTTVFPPE